MFSLVAALVLSQASCEVITQGCVPGLGCANGVLECESQYDARYSCPAGDFVSSLDAGTVVCGTPVSPPFTVSASTPSRTLNSNFQPSTTKATFVSYSVNISCTANLSGGQTSTVELRSDASATPSTVRGTAANSNSVALAIALTVVNSQTTSLGFVVPAGHYVRVNSTGTCTASLVSQTEVALN